MCCDVSSDGNYCLTCSNGFGGNGCEATVSTVLSLMEMITLAGTCMQLSQKHVSPCVNSSQLCRVGICSQVSKFFPSRDDHFS